MAVADPVHHRKPNLRWDALTPTIITTTLATAVVILRLVVRCEFVKAVGFDDFVIMVSLVSTFICRCGRCKLCTHLPQLIFFHDVFFQQAYPCDQIIQGRSPFLSFITDKAYRSSVPFLGRPWSYRGHGRDRIWQLRLVEPSGPALDDSQTLPQLERPIRRPCSRHKSFNPDSILAHLSHAYNATADVAPLCRSRTFCALGCFCFHLFLQSCQKGLATHDTWQVFEYEDVLGQRHGCEYCA